MDHPPIPPHPAHLPDWASDELPLLTETVGEPVIPLLREPLPEPASAAATAADAPSASVPAEDVPLLDEPLPAERPGAAPPVLPVPPAAPLASAIAANRTAPTASTSDADMPLAQIERELHAAAELIMQEVIDDYMLKIEAELHRRLEEHLAKVLRAGRR